MSRNKVALDHKLKSNSEAELKKLLINARGKLDPTKTYRVLFFEADKPRSLPQHKYLRYIEGLFCKEFGHDPKEHHDQLKEMFNMQLVQINGATFETAGSTTEMNTVEMTKFIDDVRRFYQTDFQFDTPDPKRIPDHIYAEIYQQYNRE